MSGKERVLRWLILGTLWSLAVWPLLWLDGLGGWDPAPVGVVLIAVFYGGWRAGADKTSHNRVTYLGSGVTVRGHGSPIWACSPYLVVGPKFKARLAARERLEWLEMVVELERDVGMDDYRMPSVWEREYDELQRKGTR